MDQDLDLSEWKTQRAVSLLRVGRTVTEAAEILGVPPKALYAAARTNDDLALAVAGHDPYAFDAPLTVQQADYLRCLALGMTTGQAERVLFNGKELVKGWRQASQPFSLAADVIAHLNPPATRPRREARFDPPRVRVFLENVRRGMSASQAAEEAGVTNSVIYQRRRRDEGFREAMDEARAEAKANVRHFTSRTSVTEEQWDEFMDALHAGMTLRRAALEAGMEPHYVYSRRRRDPEFRRATDRRVLKPSAA